MHQAICVLRYEPEKLRKITAILCGYTDGLFGLLGAFESRHPLLAAYCKREVRKAATFRRDPSTTLKGDEV